MVAVVGNGGAVKGERGAMTLWHRGGRVGEGQSCPWESGCLGSRTLSGASPLALTDRPSTSSPDSLHFSRPSSDLNSCSLPFAAQAFITYSKLDTKIGLVIITLCVVDPKRLQIYEKQAE